MYSALLPVLVSKSISIAYSGNAPCVHIVGVDIPQALIREVYILAKLPALEVLTLFGRHLFK